jgi:hypothetical protein
MATTPEARLVFRDGCPDCGERQVDLPKPLPPVDDHFDWDARLRQHPHVRDGRAGGKLSRAQPLDAGGYGGRHRRADRLPARPLLEHLGRRPGRGEAGDGAPSGIGPPAPRLHWLRRDDRDAKSAVWRRDRRRQRDAAAQARALLVSLAPGDGGGPPAGTAESPHPAPHGDPGGLHGAYGGAPARAACPSRRGVDRLVDQPAGGDRQLAQPAARYGAHR